MAEVLTVFAIVLLAIVIVPGFMWAKKRADNINAADQLADQEAARVAEEKARQIVCQHCQAKGFVTTKKLRQKQGISGGKATAAVLTGGVSVVATGLSRHGWVTKASCSNCGMNWIS